MSRWSLLKAALEGKREVKSSSIHSFTGFDNLIKGTKIIWTGFFLDFIVTSDDLEGQTSKDFSKVDPKSSRTEIENIIEVSSSRGLMDHCLRYMELIADSSCIQVNILAIGNQNVEKLMRIIVDSSNESQTSFQLKSLRTGVTNGVKNLFDKPWMACQAYVKHISLTPCLSVYECMSYHIPNCNGTIMNKIFTREVLQSRGPGSKGLLSNKIHGIDNTGNVRIWPAESLLLHSIVHEDLFSRIQLRRQQQQLLCAGINSTSSSLQSSSSQFKNLGTHSRVLELGGGNTGLCGLGIAAAGLCDSVVITDGHPDCVLNQNVCIEMCKQAGSFSTKVDVKSYMLRWSVDDSLGDLGKILGDPSRCSEYFPDRPALFDAIIVADCLFFVNYHNDLIWTLRHALAPTPTSIIYLLQPKRGSSMDIFIDLAAPWFNIDIIEDYSPKMTQLCRAMEESDYQQDIDDSFTFNKDIHLPILLILTHKSI